MTKRVMSAALICIGVLLILAALALGAYNLWDDFRAGRSVELVMDEIESLRGGNPATTGIVDSLDPDDSEIPDYVLDPNMDMPAVEIGGFRYIGTVTLPTLALELPVLESWDYDQMRIAPCRYSGSVYLKNMVICGHNYAAHFGRLDNLQTGDPVFFTDMAGNVFRYLVDEIELLDGTAVKEMKTGDWDLSLFTCDFSGRARITVRCVEISEEEFFNLDFE